MIELTPLDVRKKRGDFAKALRGYEPQEVDVFLELVAERMEVLVKENLQLKERSERLSDQVKGQEGREHAVQEALVTAQKLRQEVKEQAQREADLLEREARGRIDQMMQEAEALLAERRAALEELERHRSRFLKAFRALLERELDSVEFESNRRPLEDVPLDFELGRGSWATDSVSDTESAGQGSDDGGVPGRSGVPGESGVPGKSGVPGESGVLEQSGIPDQPAESPPVPWTTTDPAAVGATPETAPVDTFVPPDALAPSGEGAEVRGDEPVEEFEAPAPEGPPEALGGADDSLWLSSILKKDQDGAE